MPLIRPLDPLEMLPGTTDPVQEALKASQERQATLIQARTAQQNQQLTMLKVQEAQQKAQQEQALQAKVASFMQAPSPARLAPAALSAALPAPSAW